MSAVSSSTAAAQPPSQARGIPFYVLPIDVIERAFGFLDVTSFARTFTLSKGLKSEHISQMVWRKLFETHFPMIFSTTKSACHSIQIPWEIGVDWKKFLCHCIERNSKITKDYNLISHQNRLQNSFEPGEIVYERGTLFFRSPDAQPIITLSMIPIVWNVSGVSAVMSLADEESEEVVTVGKASVFNSSYYVSLTQKTSDHSLVRRTVDLKDFSGTLINDPGQHQLIELTEANVLITTCGTQAIEFWKIPTNEALRKITLESDLDPLDSGCVMEEYFIAASNGLKVFNLSDGKLLHQKSLAQLLETHAISKIVRVANGGNICVMEATVVINKKNISRLFQLNPRTAALTLLAGDETSAWCIKHDILVTCEKGNGLHVLRNRHLVTQKMLYETALATSDIYSTHQGPFPIQKFGWGVNGIVIMQNPFIHVTPQQFFAPPPIPFVSPAAIAASKASSTITATAVDKKMDK